MWLHRIGTCALVYLLLALLLGLMSTFARGDATIGHIASYANSGN